jgi:hypothetical protein
MKRAVMVCLSATFVLAAACGDTCEEPAFAGSASDEVWRVMLDARAAATTDGDVATFTEPVAGATLAAASPPTFSWLSPLKVAQALPSSTPAWRPRPKGLVDEVVALVLPPARAHLPPVTSDVYLLEVDVPGRTCPVAGLTTELGFAFSADGWATIAADGGARTARLLSAFVTDNRVTEGAFVAAPVSFTVE